MKLLIASFAFATLVAVDGLVCWNCFNEVNNDECLRNGFAKQCLSNELFCFSELRRGSDGPRLFKECKEPHACNNSVIQNPSEAWYPSQCNARTPSSVCLCCCDADLCNQPTDLCVSPSLCRPVRRHPPNGRVTCTDRNNVGSVCSYKCNPGFFLRGDESAACESTLEWSKFPPSCVPLNCIPPHIDLVNGSVTCSDENNLASFCRFTCDSTYEIVGRPSSVCLDDGNGDAVGEWSDPAPTCLKIECNPPHRNPRNGAVVCTNENFEGSLCSFTCAPGYSLEGRKRSLCRDDFNRDSLGRWTSRPPLCRRITCSPPHSNPDDGEVNCSDENLEGSLCTFSCNSGYFVDGSTNSECEDNGNLDDDGQWSNPAPVCTRITCPPPHRNPRNGDVDCSDSNNEQSLCSFTCRAGYSLSGERLSLCEDDGDNDAFGVWNNPPPSCSRVVCRPQQVDPMNGTVNCTDGSYVGSTCKFACVDNFFLDGSQLTICNDDLDGNALGIWSDPAPVCVRITCSPSFQNPSNGEVRCSNRNNILGTRCRFICDDGYFLRGGQVSRCIDDVDGDAEGIWDRPAPFCIQVTCSSLHVDPENGGVRCSSNNNAGSVCRFTCNTGYFLDGSPRSTCVDEDNIDAEGTWSALAPSCVPIRCLPGFEDPSNGRVRCDDPLNNLGTICRFQCNNGYFLNGSLTSECLDNNNGDSQGVWSNSSPFCSRITCPPSHSSPKNGAVFCTDSNSEGSLCSFMCNPGFFLDGSRMSTCIGDGDEDNEGVWDQAAPTCVPIRCTPTFSDPRNGNVICSNRFNDLGTICRFRCNEGFFLIGSPESRCEDDIEYDIFGVWSNFAPSCSRIVCLPNHVNPIHGTVSCTDGNSEESVCRFTCEANYALIGSTQSRCVDDSDMDELGEWTSEAPTCELITCLPRFTNIENGSVSCTNANIVNSVCSFTCDPAFDREGEPSSTCESVDEVGSRGQWNVFPAPVCTRKRCVQEPEHPRNGFRVCTDGRFLGSECEYGCDDYHTRIGPVHSRCVENAGGTLEWERPPPVCEPNRCPKQTLPRGVVECNDTTLTAPANCKFWCTDANYVLHPAEITENTCLNDTTWSIPRPCCTPICPPFAVMDLNVIMDSSSSIGQPNWNTMKTFVRTIIESYTVSDEAARISVFRFNEDIERDYMILLNDFPNNKEGLLARYDNISYDGNGTFTGQALKFSRNVVFRRGNGDRRHARNIILLITDGLAQDEVADVANDLRDRGVTIFVVGVFPPASLIDPIQLHEIAGDPNNVFITTTGFDGLDEDFAHRLGNLLCPDPCVDDPRL